ncbi:importin beta-like SAD2 homolog isoform X2 [Syzygium oleosum]|uniref:importin beta-like SAD2 homolog isoform X2 n=1 Tax=Syzygium oleosum TaxID=219896 RepID=UPI0024BBC873|nr:importin beta-like SAD2 homolog isoform X2 [Syzygium oleosum]
MEEVRQLAQLLTATLGGSGGGDAVRTATAALDRLAYSLPRFPFHLLSLATGGENQGLRVAAATYLKNYIRRNIGENPSLEVGKEFKDQLMQALLQVEPEILKVLVEVFKFVAEVEFVKQCLWPELVPELRLAIQKSDQISNNANCKWRTVNALTILHALIRPFQYFLNPKVVAEPVPPQLELIAEEILVPLLVVFHSLVGKVKAAHNMTDISTEKIILIICKCIHFAVRSHMPSALAPHMASFCRDLIEILDSLTFDSVAPSGNEYLQRLKAGKRSLLIFCALITRHRKHSDKLMPDIVSCALSIVKYSSNISKLDFQTERILSLAFDVISRVLETGPGWRIVSPHFSFILDSAIMPSLAMNEKDILEWEEDADEYIRKNLPSEFEDFSGWMEDLFIARKSAINLLGVMSMSKGPPMGSSKSTSSKRKKGEKNKRNSQQSSVGELLVLPFLSKFPVPTDDNASQSTILNNYFAVLTAYGGLEDFLRDKQPGYTATLLRTRVLPVYTISEKVPYLVAAANWVVGELSSCLPEDMSSEVYSHLLKALSMTDTTDTSCYPVRVAAAGAMAKLFENDYPPPEWLPLLQVVINRISNEDEESCILFELLNSLMEAGNESVTVHIPDLVLPLVGAISKFLPPNMEPWPQVAEKSFATLAVMAQCWETFISEEANEHETSEKCASGRAIIGRAFSVLLQEAWLKPKYPLESETSAPPSCIDHASTLLRSIMLSVTEINSILELKVSELLLFWAHLIADWHAWEESEDLSVFDCIKEVVRLSTEYELADFLSRRVPSPPALPVPPLSIIEGIGAFVSEAITQYPSAMCRACSCVHMLLHTPSYSPETKSVQQSLAIAFCQAASSSFYRIQRKQPSPQWKSLLLVIASCHLCFPDTVEEILTRNQDGGFAAWVSALCLVASPSCTIHLSGESEIKLCVRALVEVIERLLEQGNFASGLGRECFSSLLEATAKLKEVEDNVEEEEEEEEDEVQEESGDEDEEETDYEHVQLFEQGFFLGTNVEPVESQLLQLKFYRAA